MYSEDLKNKFLIKKRETNKSCAELAKEFGISIQTAFLWARADKKERVDSSYTIAALRKENEELKKKVSDLEEKYQRYYNICMSFQDYIKLLKDQLNKQKTSESDLEMREKRRIRR